MCTYVYVHACKHTYSHLFISWNISLRLSQFFILFRKPVSWLNNYLLITHWCDVVSAKGTLKNEGFIVAHGLNVQSIVEGEPWKQECEVLMAWQSADGREWSTALPWLFSFYFINSCSHGESCPHPGWVSPPHLLLCRNNPLDTLMCVLMGVLNPFKFAMKIKQPYP